MNATAMATSAAHARTVKVLPTLLFPADAGARLVVAACAIRCPCGMKVDVESGGNGSTVVVCTVILSGVGASRSEAFAESKDPLQLAEKSGLHVDGQTNVRSYLCACRNSLHAMRKRKL